MIYLYRKDSGDFHMLKKISFMLLLVLISITCSSITTHAAETAPLTKEATTLSTKLALVDKNATPIDWTKPSQKHYPTFHANDKISIDASISEQKVRIKKNGKTVYTMITSSGVRNTTPKGHYKIQAERGKWFYTANYHEGAKYWTSWKNHGEFLFHSVPMTKDGKVKVAEALKLGKKASHGCFRLPIPDAKWINENIPQGTAVYVH